MKKHFVTHDEQFESFLCARNSCLSDLAYELGNAICRKEVEYDMAWVGPIIDAAEAIMQSHGYDTCYPFYEENCPCYEGSDCDRSRCAFAAFALGPGKEVK